MADRGYTEADWQLFRKKVPDWQEAHMDRLNREYIQLLSGDCAPSEKFWDLERRINEDKNKAGVRLEMRRSALIDNIVGLIREGAITMEDLDGFSEELKDTVRFFLGNENVYDN